MHQYKYATHLFTGVTLVLLSSCEESTGLLRIGPPAALIVLDGQEQQGVVGQELPEALRVKVVDSASHAIPGQVVNFVVSTGGGSAFAGTSITNADGIAAERWTLGTVAGVQQLEARAVHPVTGERLVFAVFSASASAAGAASAEVVGSPQSAVAGTPLEDSIVVKVVDQYGNPVSGSVVTWATATGSVSPPTSTSNDAGLAWTRWTLGNVLGHQTATATPTGASAATISATGQNATWTVTLPVNTAVVGTPYTVTARLHDESGNVVNAQGRTIFWAASGGGSFSSPSSVVGSDNVGTVTFTAGHTAGVVHTITAWDGLFAGANGFPTVAGPAARLSFTTQPTTVGAELTMQPVRVAVQDQYGNVKGDAANSVTLAIVNNPGGAALSGTLTRPAASGVATFSDISLDKAGTGYTLGAAASGLAAGTSAPFSVRSVTMPTASTVATASGQLMSYAVTSDAVYFMDLTTPVGTFGNWAGSVKRAPLSGAGAISVATIPEAQFPARMVADETHVYWMYTRMTSGAWNMHLDALALAGGTATSVDTIRLGGAFANELLLAGDHLYVSRQDLTPRSGRNSYIYKIAKSGATVASTDVCCAAPQFLLDGSDHIFPRAGNLIRKAVGSADALSGTAIASVVGSMPATTTGPMVIAGTQLYFVADGKLKSVPLQGGTVVTHIEGLDAGAGFLATDGAAIYLVDQGTIKRFDLADFFMTVVGIDATDVLLAGDYVYWVSGSGPSVIKRALKPAN